MDVPLSLTVNGKAVTATIDPRTLLVQFLRENLQLTGTHVGCDTAQCGACTVHMNGRAIKSCSMLALQVQGSEITTIEGLAKDGELHPMQAAFRECHGLQCGFCTPGMVMSAVQLLADNPKPTKPRSAKRSTATSAAAPATRTSSSRSSSASRAPSPDRGLGAAPWAT